LEGGPPRFRQDSSCPAVLRYRSHNDRSMFRLRDSHPLRWSVPAHFRYMDRRRGTSPASALQPRGACTPVWALPISLAATPGISFDFFSSSYLDVSVRSVGFRVPIDSGRDDEGSPSPGFPIRASPDQSSRAAPRRFSQLTTPFLACPCQGIPRAPLYA
jgi:hypothetical protein